MDKTIAQSIDAIASNYSAGAAEIAELAAEVFIQFARTDQSKSVDNFRHNILVVGYKLIRAHPSMAPIVNLVNSLLWEIELDHALAMLKQTVIDVANNFKYQIHIREAAIAELVLKLIPERATIVTLSRSTTVLAALRHAHHAGRNFEVICGEGRPGFEGRTMASELNEYGVNVTLVIDALALSLVNEADLVLVGGDYLRENELVNKTGTYGLALVAHHRSVPLYALCGSSKFLPPGYTPPAQPLWPDKQVWNDPPANITIQNLYFDHVPLSYISGIVTEKAVLPTIGIEAWLASIKLHPSLKGM